MRIAFPNKSFLASLALLLLYLAYLFIAWFLLRLYVLPSPTSGIGALLGEIVKLMFWVGPLLLILKFWDRVQNVWLFLRFRNWWKGGMWDIGGVWWGLGGVAFFLIVSGYPILRGQVHLPSSWIFLAVFGLTAVIEEITFRGFLYQRMKALSNVWVAGGITSLLFACIHIPQFLLSGHASITQIALQLVSMAILSLLFTASFELSGSLLSCILIHYGYDVIKLFIN